MADAWRGNDREERVGLEGGRGELGCLMTGHLLTLPNSLDVLIDGMNASLYCIAVSRVERNHDL